MQLEPPPCTHMDSRIHTWTHWGVFSARTDVFTFIPRYMHAQTHTHSHHSPCVNTLGARCMHIHTTNNPFLPGLLSSWQ